MNSDAPIPENGQPAEPEPRGGKGWTPERRAAQAARIRANRPWLHSTGPRTEAGKAASRVNALKHGAYQCEPGANAATRALAAHKRFILDLRTMLREIRRLERQK